MKTVTFPDIDGYPWKAVIETALMNPAQGGRGQLVDLRAIRERNKLQDKVDAATGLDLVLENAEHARLKEIYDSHPWVIQDKATSRAIEAMGNAIADAREGASNA